MTSADVPEIVEGHRILRLLGSGELGPVFLAGDPVLPRDIALRILAHRLQANHDFVVEFVRAVEAASVLSHPNIVSIYSHGESNETRWLAMQFVDGGSLDRAAQTAPVDFGRAAGAGAVAEVAKALDYAHEQRVVHGAVHPGNVLLSSAASGGERVMLSDFGFARALDAAGVSRGSRAAAPYLAPEVLKGAPYDRASDVYSLGAVLFRLWAGRSPDPSRTVASQVGSLPPGCAAVLVRALARDPGDRFPSAGELASAAIGAAPIEARFGTRGPVRTAPTVRHAPTESQTSPHRRSRLPGWGTVAAVALLVTVAMVLALSAFSVRSVSGTPTASDTAAAVVPLEDLPKLLLGQEDLRQVFGVTMTTTLDGPKLALEAYGDDGCAGASAAGEVREYTGTGFLGVQYQRWQEVVPPGGVDGILPQLVEAVVAFPSAKVAQLFYQRSVERWTACGGRKLEVFPGGQLVLSDLKSSDGVLTLRMTVEGGLGVGCGRALTVRNNVSVDVSACFSNDDEAKTRDILDRIAQRVPQ